jgi:predicted O-linked N-acetylglucosamine transferase (SPINDLY family)
MWFWQAHPRAVLWLLEMPAAAGVRLRAEAKKAGVDPARIVFTPLFPRELHLKARAAPPAHRALCAAAPLPRCGGTNRAVA